jgi:hypothetical protein
MLRILHQIMLSAQVMPLLLLAEDAEGHRRVRIKGSHGSTGLFGTVTAHTALSLYKRYGLTTLDLLDAVFLSDWCWLDVL